MAKTLLGKYRIRLNIKALCEEQGILSGYALTKALSVNPKQGYALYEEKPARLELETIAKLCEVFRCTPEKFLVRERSF